MPPEPRLYPNEPSARIAALRRDGLSPIGIGCARIGSVSSGITAEQASATFTAAHARGITLFDTAGIYGGGDSERLVGAHARRHPGSFVMTKIGRRHGIAGRAAHWMKRWAGPLIGRRARTAAATARQRGVALDFSTDALEAATRAALRRLGTSSVSALLLHSPPAAVLADTATARTLTGLKERGMAEQIGVSCDEIDALERAAAFETLDIVQLPIGLYRRARVEGLIDRLVDREVAIVVRGVLGARQDMTPRLALAAAAALPGVASVIVGVSSPEHLADLLDAGSTAAR